MITSLEDAWNWYVHARQLMKGMHRLGLNSWDQVPSKAMQSNKYLRDLNSGDVIDRTRHVLDYLDDLCVLLLFSVFEAEVRKLVLQDVKAQLAFVLHPVLHHAVTSFKDNIESGSFFRILEPYKSLDTDLTEQVNQVRRYRNWVAHGRHGTKPDNITPEDAYPRLQQFLGLLDATKLIKEAKESHHQQ